jgi:coenzyme PQQ biosynthesis protein PqqD
LNGGDVSVSPDAKARLDERPVLAPKARLRVDARTERCWLLYPERGLLLEGSAEALLRECNGERTLSEVLSRAAAAHGVSPDAIAAEAAAFLDDLTARGLLVWK